MKVPDLVTLTCVQVTELATDYMTAELDPSERARFEQHLYACTWCMTHVNQLRRTVDWTNQVALAQALPSPETRETLRDLFKRSRQGSEP
jgi:anti-sigma factor RsiW